MKDLLILLSFIFGIGLTVSDAQTTPQNGVANTTAKTKEIVTHNRRRGVATVSETTVSNTTTKGGSKRSTNNTTVKETVKAKAAPVAPNGNKSAQDAWDGK